MYFQSGSQTRFFLANLALEDPQQVFTGYVPMNALYQESEWCQAGTIEHFEKMARFHGNCQIEKYDMMTDFNNFGV